MRFVHYLQHWLGGTGAHLQVTDFVPVMHPLRQWADTFPWAALGSAIEHSFNKRFPKKSPRGRTPCPSASCSPWSCSNISNSRKSLKPRHDREFRIALS